MGIEVLETQLQVRIEKTRSSRPDDPAKVGSVFAALIAGKMDVIATQDSALTA